MKRTMLPAMCLLLTACAVDRCPECGEPNIPPPVPRNVQLYRQCVQQLPLEQCNAMADKWAMEDQLHRLEMQNAQMMQNQNMMFMYQNLPGRRY